VSGLAGPDLLLAAKCLTSASVPWAWTPLTSRTESCPDRYGSSLFPFGYGLSYTTFAYANLKITGSTVEADVINTGTRTGAEIAQVYVGSPASAAVPEAPQELTGFQKVLLRAGQTKHVTFALDSRSFSHWDTASHSWKVTAGTYQILVGGGSRDIRLRGTIKKAAS
jgi:beta-glucosidase